MTLASVLLAISFFGLASYAKAFSYLHLQLGLLPLYVGEVALMLALFWTFRNRARLRSIPRPFYGLLSAYLGVGVIRLLASFSTNAELGTVQILRDSALHYQALWVLFGLSFDEKTWVRFFSVSMAGVGFSQLIGWAHFFRHGILLPDEVVGLGTLPGNEVVTSLFPLVLLIWEARWVAAFLPLFGLSLLGQLLVYLKKNWVFTVFVLAVPAALAGKGWRRRTVVLTGSLAAGLVVALASASLVNYRSNGLFFQFLESGLYKGMGDPDRWLYHGEKMMVGGKLSFIAWRWHLWTQTWAGFMSSPLFGLGFGPRTVETLITGAPAFHEGAWISGPHNSFLTVAFRSGLLGVLPLAGMVLYAAWLWAKGWFVPVRSRFGHMAAVCFASLTLYAAFNVCLENPHHGIWFWIFLGAAVRFNAGSDRGDRRLAPGIPS